MNNYKIYNSKWSVVKMFASLAAAELWRDENKPECSIKELGAVPKIDLETKLDLDLNFGKHLIREFVKDNRIAQISSVEEDVMMVKFNVMLNYANVGAIRKISEMLPNEPITSVFTQERKDKYLQMITDYLNSL